MPRRPKTICRQPGCGKVIDTPGYCESHKRAVQKQQDERRGTAHERGYTNRWREARSHYLRKHPLCVNCQLHDRLTAASVVDHIIAHKLKEAIDSGDEARIARAKALFWDSANWASLCKPCHDTVAQSCERTGRLKPWARQPKCCDAAP